MTQRHLRSKDRQRRLSRTLVVLHAGRLRADPANGLRALLLDLIFSVFVFASRHLIIEVLRRPVEFTLFSIKEKTRIGATYLSPVKLKFDLPTNFTGLGPILTASLGASGLLNSTIGMEVKVPQSLVLSVYHDIDEKWAVMGNLGWQNWSQFGLIGITVAAEDTQSLTADRQYKDTAHVAIGTRFAPVQQWILSLGFAYDSSAVTDENRTIDAPLGQAFRIGTGVEWLVVPAVNLGLAYELTWFGDLPVNQQGGPLNGDVVGSYNKTAIHFIALSLQWNIGAKKDPDG